MLKQYSIFSTIPVAFFFALWLDDKFLSPFSWKRIPLAAGILVVLSVIVVMLFKIFNKLINRIETSNFSLSNYFTRLVKIMSATAIALSFLISSFGLFWENKETKLKYFETASNAPKDVNVIFILIDALRPDHLSCYGYGRKTSPNIDALARDGIIFSNCISTAAWTRPSVPSILTSLYPSTHGCWGVEDKLPEEAITLAELIKENGYLTYAYSTNVLLKAMFNYDQGFEFFDDYLIRDKMYEFVIRSSRWSSSIKKWLKIDFSYYDRMSIELANKRIISWLKNYKDNNFFMYIHYMDVHAPYRPPPPYDIFYFDKKGLEKKIALYDGGIYFEDYHLGKLIDELKSLGIFEKTLIIISADHGESFGEHGYFTHGHYIYEDQVRVPLIMHYAGLDSKGMALGAQVSTIDIMPTILDFLDISTKTRMEGISLMPLIKKLGSEKIRQDIFIDNYVKHDKCIAKGIRRENRWKYIYTEESSVRDIKSLGQEELYDLSKDPGEIKNLVNEETIILKELRQKLNFYNEYTKRQRLSTEATEIGEGTVKQLKALGYLQ